MSKYLKQLLNRIRCKMNCCYQSSCSLKENNI